MRFVKHIVDCKSVNGLAGQKIWLESYQKVNSQKHFERDFQHLRSQNFNAKISQNIVICIKSTRRGWQLQDYY